MGGACGMHGGEEAVIQKVAKPERKGPSVEPRIM